MFADLYNLLRRWLASLRIRLVITYVLVTALSFGLLLVMVMPCVERFMLQREENSLAFLARTIGSTIRDPWKFTEQDWQADQFWTQRRSYDIASEVGVQIRMLDPGGQTLTDSAWGHCSSKEWATLLDKRAKQVSLSAREEVQLAMRGAYGAHMWSNEGLAGGAYTMYVACPILRTHPQTGKHDVAFIMYINKPMSSVLQDLHELRQYLKYSMIASLLITILVSVLLSGHLVAGFHAAMRVARAFAAGNMHQRMRTRGWDEVGQLGMAFNQMADAIQRQEQLRRDLLADVSHELRTPLTAISGCADTLADGVLREDPEAAEHFLGIIQRESQRLQRLVSDILELSKLQAGVTAIPLSPIQVCPLIDDAVEIAHMHARQDGISVHCEYPEECLSNELLALGNEDRLAQALMNLLDNARHHTPAGHAVTIAVQVLPDTVIIHVRDEGKGIPKDDLPWVFDRFYRAGKGEKYAGGTGLGLAIVREIMLAHGGKITVESALNQGTTFSLHLQRVQAECHE